MLELLPAAAYVCEAPDGRIAAWNRRAAELWGREPRQGESDGALWGAHPPTEGVFRDGEPKHADAEMVRAGGQRRTMSLDIEPVRDGEGRVTAAVIVFHDVTTRRRANDLRAAERLALQQLAAGMPLEAVLETLTRMVDGYARGELVSSILLLHGNRLRDGAAPGLPPEYRRAIDGIAIGPAVGSCGTAAYLGKPVVVTDIATDPLWEGYRELALGNGLRACWSTPIRGTDGAILGTFAVYYPQPSEPVRDHLQLVEFATRTAAIAIERDRGERERRDLLARERQARQQAALILNSITDAFASLDGEFRFTYINPAAERMLGRTRDELEGRELWKEFPAVLGTGAERAYRLTMLERVPQHFEMVYGPWERWFEATTYPSDDGGLTIYFRDITERKHQEERIRMQAEELRKQGEWLGAVLDLLPTPMIFVEPGSACATFANRAANDLAGGEFPLDRPAEDYHKVYRCSDVQGHRIPDAEMPGVRLARGEPVAGVEMTWHTPGGDRSVLVSGDTMPAMHGHPPMGVLTFQDITPLKRTEEALRHAQKLESLGVLAGGIAHDFNNLLVGIMGNASLLMDDAQADSPGRPMLEGILQASQRAADLTRQLLAYSGKGRFVVQPLDLSKEAREIGSLVGTSVQKNVTLRFELGANLPPVMADASQVQQIIMNLALNGAEAIPEGRAGTVTVRTGTAYLNESELQRLDGASLKPGEYVWVEVADTGAGMDEGTRTRIFDPFFTTKFTGRGLGLAAVLGIVRGHHGAIRLETAPGKGTTFVVYLPAFSGERQEAESEPQAPDLHGSGLILVADDEDLVRRMAARALERCGYTVEAAETGPEAVAAFREMKDQLRMVLLDLTMPGLSGEAVLEEMWRVRPGVRVLLSSGYSEAEANRRFAGKGLAGFLQKPYTAARLARKVKDILRDPERTSMVA